MKALSIRQPWAWLILHAGKTIENRTRFTKHRGPFWIHASATLSRREYWAVRIWLLRQGLEAAEGLLPEYEHLLRGGIVGRATLVECVTRSNSPWFEGPVGWVLKDPGVEIPFRPCPGRLGWFEA